MDKNKITSLNNRTLFNDVILFENQLLKKEIIKLSEELY